MLHSRTTFLCCNVKSTISSNKTALNHLVLTQTNVNLCTHNFACHLHIDLFTQHCNLACNALS